MPKELFNQELINSPVEPDDSDRIAMGQPSVSGGRNITWGRFKEIINGILSSFNFIKFNPQTPAQQTYEIGKIFYDSTENTWTAYNDIEGISLQLGEELRGRLVNDTGVTLLDGKAVSIIGAVGASLKVELTDASDQDSSIRGYGLMTITTINGNPGYAITYGAVRGLDTSLFSEGDIVYVDPQTPGELTNVRPIAPFYPIRIGICLASHPSQGVIAVSTLAFNGSDTSVNIEGALNGIVLDTPNVNFTVSGGNIYADLTNEKYPSRNLPFIFGGKRYALDTLTNTGAGGAARVIIPPGTDTTLQASLMYVYLDNGTPTFGVSTSEPNFPYARIGSVAVYSPTRTTTEGKVFAYRRSNNTTDRLDGVHDGSYGIIEEILFWARTLGSSWLSGLDATPTVNDTTIRVALTGGTGRQFRRANLPTFDGLSYRIYNDVNNVAGNYPIVNNLTSITTTAGGSTDDLLSNNRYYTIRLYYQLNSNGIGNNIIATRPTGFYTTPEDAISDANGYATVFNDPLIEEVVFPIYDLVIGRTGTGGSTITLVQLNDRRSKLPFGSGGGGASGGGGVDEKVRVSATDTTTDYLGNKVTASDGLAKEIVNQAGNEQINITGKHIPLLYWQYNSSTSDVDPGDGKFIVGSGFINMYISPYNNGSDVGNILKSIKNGAKIYIQARDNKEVFLSLDVVGDAIDNSTYVKIPTSVYDSDIALTLDQVCGFTFLQASGSSIDYENIFFEVAAPDVAYITRGFSWKVTVKTDYGGTVTLVTSADAAYTLNDTVSAGGYLKASSDTAGARTVLTIKPA